MQWIFIMNNMSSQNAVDLHLILKWIIINSQNTGNLHYDYMSSQNQNKLSNKKPTLFIKHNTDDVHDLDFIHLMTYSYTVCIMLVMHMILITTTDNCL